ncbi:MAG: hypothetical protein P8129_08025 [Anaerolineae bacterium]
MVPRKGREDLEKGEAINSEIPVRADEDKVIPWAEGNGLWGTLTKLVSDLVAADLVTFLIRNPYTCDSVTGLALAIGRVPGRVQPVLESLAEAGFLQFVDLAEVRVYQLTDDAHRRQTLQQYVTWLQEGYHWTRLAMDR